MRMGAQKQKETDAPSKLGRRVAAVLLWGIVALLVVVACTALMYALMQQPVSQLESVVERVRRWKLASVAFQTLVCVAIVAAWPSVVVWCRRRAVIQEHEVVQVIAARWKAAALLGTYLSLVAMGPAEMFRLAGSLFQG
ncbi:hypothetical protein LJR039_007211 [Pseudorhodoferax sp. LjRoot39]|uniref:hypothetical protein n=1 Tax=Pseudorhodoferax sp. LjRoot39 TaxID=3342328 RepID=UPI003ECC977B